MNRTGLERNLNLSVSPNRMSELMGWIRAIAGGLKVDRADLLDWITSTEHDRGQAWVSDAPAEEVADAYLTWLAMRNEANR